ncbi:hypothetical protein HPB49_012023 [Dermacentor silvarum]|uniref:Uncharacterized protein n=1 Tax=Dermacentor silvarum TaxID=543639 RepID=A0ACB8DPD3_DERSI|nr:hypothetical protein HPB49_012023 [Dermacentor silvarum]
MRRVSFMEPLPTTCVCAICCVLPAKIMNLPCGHAVCLACWYNPYDSADKPHQDSKALSMFRSAVCPMDGVPFADPQLEVVTCPKGVYNKLVFCVNNVFGCRSIVELGHLKAHCLHECRFNSMTCRAAFVAKRTMVELFLRHMGEKTGGYKFFRLRSTPLKQPCKFLR